MQALQTSENGIDSSSVAERMQRFAGKDASKQDDKETKKWTVDNFIFLGLLVVVSATTAVNILAFGRDKGI